MEQTVETFSSLVKRRSGRMSVSNKKIIQSPINLFENVFENKMSKKPTVNKDL